MDKTPESSKLDLVVIHLEGKAFYRCQSFLTSKGLPEDKISWLEYKESIAARFSGKDCEDPMSEVRNLYQTESLQAYQEKFDMLLSKLVLPDDYAITLHSGGLRTKIQNPVRMLEPKTLHKAFKLAKLQEATCRTQL